MTINILITGGGGFIGRNLVKYYSNRDVNITVLDTFISSKEDEFYNFIGNVSNITIYKENICQFSSDIKFNYIYHLASIASPPLYKTFPLETMDTNYLGTKLVLELAKKNNSRVLYASTSEIYGDPFISPQHEDYYGNVNSFGERSCYDISKRIGETLCYSYINKFGLDVKIARIFNTYGPGMMINDGRIITECIKHLINNTEMTIYGNGKQTRSICYISDTVDMLVDLINSDCKIPVNIGNDIELSINEIVDIVEYVYRNKLDSNLDSKLIKNYIPLTQNDPLKRKPSLIRNKKILGERKYTSLKDGILNTINYFLTSVKPRQKE